MRKFSIPNVVRVRLLNPIRHKWMYAFCLLFLFSAPLIAKQNEPIANYEVLFTPRDKVADELIRLIRQERQSLRVAVYCLMHRGISKALIDAKKKGVNVEVIVDPFSVKQRSPLKKMADAGISIFVWNPGPIAPPSKFGVARQRKSLMHDKFCVFGNRKVWTGSFNFTFDAATNHRENAVILESVPIAKQYLEEFEEIKKSGCVSYSAFLKKTKNK